MPKVFLSYRRDDTNPYAGRLYDRLAARFGEKQIFMDIDQIRLGEDFVDVINQCLEQAIIMIVLIGRQWLTLVDKEGRRRLDDPDDFVRIEVAAALNQRIWVIPVLVGGALMPRAEDLPEVLQVSDTSFHRDVDHLIMSIEETLEARTDRSPQIPAVPDSSRTPMSEKTRVASNRREPGAEFGRSVPDSLAKLNWKIISVSVGILAILATYVLLVRNSNQKSQLSDRETLTEQTQKPLQPLIRSEPKPLVKSEPKPLIKSEPKPLIKPTD